MSQKRMTPEKRLLAHMRESAETIRREARYFTGERQKSVLAISENLKRQYCSFEKMREQNEIISGHIKDIPIGGKQE